MPRSSRRSTDEESSAGPSATARKRRKEIQDGINVATPVERPKKKSRGGKASTNNVDASDEDEDFDVVDDDDRDSDYDSADDESMEKEQELKGDDGKSFRQDGKEDKKMPATTGESAGVRELNFSHLQAEMPPAKRVAVMERLRVPSEQTPGRPRETAILNRDEIPLPSMRLMLDDRSLPAPSPARIIHPPLERRDDNVTNGTMGHPEDRRYEEEATDLYDDDEERVIKAMSTTTAWFGYFLFLILLFSGFKLHPIFRTLGGHAKATIDTYKKVLGVAPLPIAVHELNESVSVLIVNETILEQAVNKTILAPVISAPAINEEEEKEAIQRTRSQIGAMQSSMSRLSTARGLLAEEFSSLEQTVAELRDFLQTGGVDSAHIQMLQKAVQDVSLWVGAEQDSNPDAMAKLRDIIGSGQDFLLDFSKIQFWNVTVSTEECEQIVAEPEEGVVENVAVEASQNLKHDIQEATEKIKADANIADALVAWILADVGDRFSKPVTVVEPPKTPRPRGSNLKAIRKMIQARLEIEVADRTGKVDYASLQNGAMILYGGRYGTSPSLIDRLPYLNRLASALSLRFYGYGPEAALTATYPPDALGQCWAFEKDEDGQREGRFGTLAIRLAKPIYVTSVSIEHPPKEINDKAKASIRRARVFGFESPDATGKPWPIGNVEYMLSGDIIQEFEMNDVVKNEDVPPLQSISFAIDMNWGLHYSCLYRLRVHGDEVDE